MFWINGYAQTQVAFVVKTEGDNILKTKFVDVFDRDQGFIKKVPVVEEFLLEIEKESISLVFWQRDLKFSKSNWIFLKIGRF